jgi:hypothetical protein
MAVQGSQPCVAVVQKGETGQCVFGKIILVLVHHRVAKTNHSVYTISRGPYKRNPDGACRPPHHLPGRTCVTWVPDVDFDAVEEWWHDIVTRPCMQQDVQVDTAAPTPRFVEEHFMPQNPFSSGAQMVKVRLA